MASDRVHFVRGGKLAPLLDSASSAVTVNSTSAQQALWRGLPLKCFGAAVYDKPEFVSDQPLADFFRSPKPPDSAAYRLFRHYLLRTSQLPGSFYSARGRRRSCGAVDRMLSEPMDVRSASEARNRHQSNTLQSVR
jgi:capsular polysaccharide export protein